MTLIDIARPARKPPVWSYLVADLRTNAILDEIPIAGVSWYKQINDSGTLTASWQLAVNDIRDANILTTPARTAIYAVRDGAPLWGGLIWTRVYSSKTQTVQIGCGDFGTYFDHRKVVPLLGAVGADTHIVGGLSVTYTATEQNEIARQLVALAQSHTGGDIGIQFDTSSSGTTRDRTYFGYELNGTLDMLKLMAGLQDGCDFMFDVTPGVNTDRPNRVLLLGDPQLGQIGSPHRWEVGGNVLDYEWPSDGTAMATREYSLGDGIEQAALIAVAEDFSRYVNGWPVLEDETSYTTVSDDDTLNQHAASDLVARRLPIVLPKLTVDPTRPPFLGEYNVGDEGQLAIQDAWFRDGIDTTIRIVRQDVSPDGSDGETTTLTCAPTLEDVV